MANGQPGDRASLYPVGDVVSLLALSLDKNKVDIKKREHGMCKKINGVRHMKVMDVDICMNE